MRLSLLVRFARMLRLRQVVFLPLVVVLLWTTARDGAGPYPPSAAVAGIVFDWTTHQRLAQGSDNWPVTWAGDGHQYTSWGDGGGFGGSNEEGRVSLGFGRVEGSAENYQGVNLWGGYSGKRPASFTGKSYGILAVQDALYAWRCGDASEETAFKFQELYRSPDNGLTWEFTGVRFHPGLLQSERGFFCPAFLQFGPGYAGARDGYVYMYAPEIQSDAWQVQQPGEISLVRAPLDGLEDIEQYEYFAGLDASGEPGWSQHLAGKKPVFEDREHGIMHVSAVYNAGLGRYFLIAGHSEHTGGNIGIYDAPAPWGPWTTVLFQYGFGAGHIQSSTFYWNFSNKWTSPDGLEFVLVFTGTGENDSWNTVHGRFILPSPSKKSACRVFPSAVRMR